MMSLKQLVSMLRINRDLQGNARQVSWPSPGTRISTSAVVAVAVLQGIAVMVTGCVDERVT